ncbi:MULTISPECIES: hypothetical protein [Metabacillus]|uniref:Uncharacterized protein n=1 Tax=Metabacillus indicus TaxID=246786 RepID=A0A084H0W8_METID|nr:MULTISPECIES: hypothetical protein [Metabacillus]KEZ50448.1 hypothetical protein AZ46_0207140 [Metabacillus indicus LMG 22858]KEZ53230.1 hypothetical protein GS18_0207995 [Metabacillus indicus]MDX8291621.1 hypothetical protein [Metabacillus indicus]
MHENVWIKKYTVLDKTREQLIQDLEIPASYFPYIDAAKLRIQETGNNGPVHDAGDQFLEFLKEESLSSEDAAG